MGALVAAMSRCSRASKQRPERVPSGRKHALPEQFRRRSQPSKDPPPKPATSAMSRQPSRAFSRHAHHCPFRPLQEAVAAGAGRGRLRNRRLLGRGVHAIELLFHGDTALPALLLALALLGGCRMLLLGIRITTQSQLEVEEVFLVRGPAKGDLVLMEADHKDGIVNLPLPRGRPLCAWPTAPAGVATVRSAVLPLVALPKEDLAAPHHAATPPLFRLHRPLRKAEMREDCPIKIEVDSNLHLLPRHQGTSSAVVLLMMDAEDAEGLRCGVRHHVCWLLLRARGRLAGVLWHRESLLLPEEGKDLPQRLARLGKALVLSVFQCFFPV
mmetsp:Transcript_40425/g.93922  ORF Transcript_40425/g.93922 Transcript_40425/m.93922 type:complete len:327 (-) Transcript_40425:345-1325(-)